MILTDVIELQGILYTEMEGPRSQTEGGETLKIRNSRREGQKGKAGSSGPEARAPWWEADHSEVDQRTGPRRQHLQSES